MAKIDFPTPPTLNEVFVDDLNQTWIYNGDAWVRTKTGSGIPEPTRLGVQMARQVDEAGLPGKWLQVAVDVWYLGAYADPPSTNNEDEPLTDIGYVYYNTTNDKMYSWDGDAWRPFAPTYEIFGLTSYTYILTSPLLVGSPLTGPDIYGNTPSGWQNGQTLVTVFRNAPGGADADTGGSRLSPQLDVSVAEEEPHFSIDFSLSQVTPINVQWETGDQITLQISSLQLGQDASTFPWVVDEDTMVSDTDTKVPTQQSVKAYADAIPTGRKNLLDNGDFRIDQQGNFPGHWNSIILGQFGHDRWRASRLPQSLINSKEQTVFNSPLIVGEWYTLSWEGDTGEGGELYMGPDSQGIGLSPVTVQYVTAYDWIKVNLNQNATNIQLERGKRATPFEMRTYAEELRLCQHYLKPWQTTTGVVSYTGLDLSCPTPYWQDMNRFPDFIWTDTIQFHEMWIKWHVLTLDTISETLVSFTGTGLPVKQAGQVVGRHNNGAIIEIAWLNADVATI